MKPDDARLRAEAGVALAHFLRRPESRAALRDQRSRGAQHFVAVNAQERYSDVIDERWWYRKTPVYIAVHFPDRPNEPVVVFGAGPPRQLSGPLSGDEAEKLGLVLRRPEELTIGMVADAVTRAAPEDTALLASVAFDLGRPLTNA